MQRVYLHLDVDVLDPAIAEANGFAVPDGLTIAQVLDVLRLVKAHVQVVACDVASYDPSYDPHVTIVQAGFQWLRELLP